MSGLSFDITWDDSQSTKPADATRGTLIVRLASKVIWGRETADGTIGIEWTWIDFLEHIGRIWPLLRWQPYPLGLSPTSPSDFPALAREVLNGILGSVRDSRETEVWSFAEAHDLSHAVPGVQLPSLWLVPEGNFVNASGAGRTERLPLEESIGTLEQFCDAVTSRLENNDHPRATLARETWQSRNLGRVSELVELYTGWSAADIRASRRASSVPAVFGLGRVFHPNSLLALARAVRGYVSPQDLGKIITAVEKADATDCAELQELSARISRADLVGNPWEQGFAAAAALRTAIGNLKDVLDPLVLLKRWGVPVRETHLSTKRIDAVAAWGPDHGPVVVLNTNGSHSHGRRGRNATLGHEICHLLLDRADALPLAEAVGGLVPADVEARARAFAAELLVPRQEVIEYVRAGESIESSVRGLARRYGASSELIAWQIRNSEVGLERREVEYLRTLVSRPQLF